MNKKTKPSEPVDPLQKANAALSASEEKYRLLVQNSQEAIFVVQKGLFKFVNRAFEQMTGLPESELLGRSALEFVPKKDQVITSGSPKDKTNIATCPLRTDLLLKFQSHYAAIR